MVVLGTIHGNVEASDKIDIRKDAKLVGDIKTARIVIEDGAYFKGSIDIARTEAARTPAPAQAKAQSQLLHYRRCINSCHGGRRRFALIASLPGHRG